MDPNATLARLNAALADGDLDGAREALSDLSEWLRSGGFLPDAWVSRLPAPPVPLPGPQDGPLTLASGSLARTPGAAPEARWTVSVDSRGTLALATDNGRTVRRASVRAIYQGHGGAAKAPKGDERWR